MNPSKDDLIDSLHKIICSGTTTAGDARVANNEYFKRRVLGFKAEIAFQNKVAEYSGIKFLEGGQFISKKLSGNSTDKNRFIYTTVSYDNPENYKKVYKVISGWGEVEDLIFIQAGDENWTEEAFITRNERGGTRNADKVLKPKYTFYLYDKTTGNFVLHPIQDFTCILSKFGTHARTPNLYHLRSREQFEYFREYDEETLKRIYAVRYFMDVVLRQAQGRQIIDLDGFLQTSDKLIITEIKEKSPIKTDPANPDSWLYGWDSRRILWYLYLFKKIQLEVLYNVRQVTDRNTRSFVQWDSVFIDDFLNGISWSSSRGGGGGEDTLLAPYTHFSRLEDILRNLQA